MVRGPTISKAGVEENRERYMDRSNVNFMCFFLHVLLLFIQFFYHITEGLKTHLELFWEKYQLKVPYKWMKSTNVSLPKI